MLVSADELIEYLSKMNLNAPQKAEAELILSGVQGELETYCNRPLELTQIREAVQTDGSGFATLSVSPVHKIVEVTAVGVAYTLSVMSLYTPVIPVPMERDLVIGVGGRMIDTLAAGVAYGAPHIVAGGVYVGAPNSYYIINYVGGYNLQARGEYESVRTAIKRVAAREVGPMYDDSLSLRDGNAEKASEPDDRGKGWTEEELMRFDRLRRRVVV